jgi:transposase-like protein
MSGRKTKLSPALQRQIIKLLKQGNTVEDVCNQVDISKTSFYAWRARGEVISQLLEADPNAAVPKDDLAFLEFLNATTRAFENAKVKAVSALFGAIQGQKTVEKSTTTFEETRIRKTKEGPKKYTYRRTTKSEKVIQHAPDPRTAIEYLKRRYPDEWSDRLKIDVDPALLKELASVAANANVPLAELLKALLDELKSDDDSLPAYRA